MEIERIQGRGSSQNVQRIRTRDGRRRRIVGRNSSQVGEEVASQTESGDGWRDEGLRFGCLRPELGRRSGGELLGMDQE
ncbi:hypothetical protein NPIL_438511 [Nephila pilipes]|uniref:Uncharacterized protein n=1 Tax=Nephila pilipes TaxID=299642 RepID=A0A8X6UFF7_NEPPI|nr:hypothetical protein NPIL_438511 [Nephila pilipes]